MRRRRRRCGRGRCELKVEGQDGPRVGVPWRGAPRGAILGARSLLRLQRENGDPTSVIQFRRWGLQRRIMAYVTAGLVGAVAAFLFVGLRAVGDSTDLVFDERLAIAQNVAAALGREIEHVVPDIEEETGSLTATAASEELEATLDEIYLHLTGADDFAFIEIGGVWLVDGTGDALAIARNSAAAEQPVPTAVSGSAEGVARIVWPEEGSNPRLLMAVVPVRGNTGSAWAWVVVEGFGQNGQGMFVPFGLPAPGDTEADVSPLSEYHLEVMTESGTVVLAVGPDETVGVTSVHYEVIRDWIGAGVSGTTLHDPGDSDELGAHVMAAAPVPGSPLYLVLEQDEDVALAVTARFRSQVFLISALGFIAALTVAWLTTQRVVRPTRQLTAAAERMAAGELSTPIQVDAQDEIGVLAEHLEEMRQQLRRALDEVEAANVELESRVQQRTRQLEELVHRALTVQEDERRRVAMELHDETAQALTAVAMRIDAIAREGERTESEAAGELREAHQMVGLTLEGVRRMINALGPAALERRGVGAALRAYTEEFLGRFGVEIRFDLPAGRRRLPEDVELALYRIGQEALNNAVAHAEASRIEVSLVVEGRHATLTVSDDGIGFQPASAVEVRSGSRGLGIAGMRERARLIGGSLELRSSPGAGTTVVVTVPVDGDA